MSILSFANGRVLVGGRFVQGAVFDVRAGRIADVDVGEWRPDAIDLQGGVLLPGFIDTQVNGGGGVLFNDDPSVAGIRRIAEAHRPFGTTALMPTLISDDLAQVEAALQACDDAIDAGVAGVVGVHIEGPFLNRRRRGIHREDKIRAFDPQALALLAQKRRGVVMVTLAPENVPPADIARLVAAGVKVSIGHTDADYATAMAAFAAGASGVTHLFNAMSPLHHRDPGAVGAALDHARAWCGIIADGIHVHPAALRIVQQVLPPERLMLVTDAMPSVGSAATSFNLQGRQIYLHDGRLTDEAGTLAGCHLTMNQALRHMTDEAGTTLVAAAMMAATNPAAFLGIEAERGASLPGRFADFVWLDAQRMPVAVWQAGIRDEAPVEVSP